ncbi:type II toxin-antitoxin system HipA family toxin [Mariniphaga sediminis]|uniref:Type II toxin-antitoxin system HipA family toxin n=1 Tax=Mariniphaga sediminis TaxID=1628158 RepID=A0A399D7Y3_9BACT|nr:HipA domain-containing protein [Mariniphaga sediminis]RIH67168.1 type II toxin-antitoxin system HipA family toxin [Mariniphaga sediminis]
MTLPELKYCPGTLAEGFNTYSTACLRRVFQGRKVSHVLPYAPPQSNEEDAEKFIENRKRISISGVQEKLSLILEKNKLRLTKEGEQGTYLLKPIPRDVKNVSQVPANEHLTMQIARQVYGLQTAENALIFFSDGEPAYITKRFDVKEDGLKWGKEDFASLAGKTEENAGQNFKYDFSYEEMGELLKKYVPAWRVEIEKLFSLIVFNFLFSNGDAHLKNYALLETSGRDYVLSPAYDLLNTKIHVDDTDFALNGGLFSNGFQSEAMRKSNHPGLHDFQELAGRFEIDEKRRDRILKPFLQVQPMVEELTRRSFLNEKTKRAFILYYQTKRNQLNSI